MAKEEGDINKIVLTRLMRLNATVHGVVYGILAGLGIFVATNWLVVKGGEVVGPNLSLLANYLIGYQVTFAGSLIGFAYGFVGGFFFGYFVARLYNWILDKRAGIG